jgi:glycosyltransferase involved in cell wall biosynthesis
LRPAIYYPWVYLKGGAERTLLELVRRSRHEWVIYTNHYDPADTFPEFASLDIRALSRVSVKRTIGSVARASLTLLTQSLDLNGHESLVVVSEGLGNLVAMRSRIPVSCVCLTPLKVVYDDFSRERFLASRKRPLHSVALNLYRAFDRYTWGAYERVFCNSEEVRRRLLSAGLVEAERLEVAHHGVDADQFRQTGERQPFFLVPGRIMWQKNAELAIEAWLRFKPRSEGPLRLVIAGMVDAKSRPYVEQLRGQAGGRADIEFIESPSDQELIRLYQTCLAVVFPAMNEDWGLVPLEAMACGKPVLATARGGPLESVVDGASGLLRPDQPEDFASGMAELANLSAADLDAMGERARLRALQFGWDGFVTRMDAHVEELAGMRHGLRAQPPLPVPTNSPMPLTLPVVVPDDPAVTVPVAVTEDAPVTLG